MKEFLSLKVRPVFLAYILCLLAPTSCSILFKRLTVEPVKMDGYTIEKEFIEHVEEFERVCGRKVHIDMFFASLPNIFGGMCHTWVFVDGGRYIEIDLEYWSTLTHFERESIIAHELGHCVLGRLMHDNRLKIFEDGYKRPMSIMQKNVMDPYDYLENRDEYLKELCGN